MPALDLKMQIEIESPAYKFSFASEESKEPGNNLMVDQSL